jgi:hypothetical protein
MLAAFCFSAKNSPTIYHCFTFRNHVVVQSAKSIDSNSTNLLNCLIKITKWKVDLSFKVVLFVVSTAKLAQPFIIIVKFVSK